VCVCGRTPGWSWGSGLSIWEGPKSCRSIVMRCRPGATTASATVIGGYRRRQPVTCRDAHHIPDGGANCAVARKPATLITSALESPDTAGSAKVIGGYVRRQPVASRNANHVPSGVANGTHPIKSLERRRRRDTTSRQSGTRMAASGLGQGG
jgi:hypothetical protein